MITFENSLFIPGDIAEIYERLWQGKPILGHDDYSINLVERVDEDTYLLFIKEAIFGYTLGYHVHSTQTGVNQLTWQQIDHKRFIDRTIRWTLEPQDDGAVVSYQFAAKVVGGEVGETITRKVLLETSKAHLDRLLADFKDQMQWVNEVSKKPPAIVD